MFSCFLVFFLFFSFLFPNNVNYVAKIINYPQLLPPNISFQLKQHAYLYLRLPLILGSVLPLVMACFIIPIMQEYHSDLVIVQRMAAVNFCIIGTISIVWDILTFFSFSLLYIFIVINSGFTQFTFKQKASKFLFFILSLIDFVELSN